MERRSLEDLSVVARVTSDRERRLSRRERLERWAKALEAEHSFNTLHGVEFVCVPTRHRMRANDSPLTAAYRDPLLRREGLADDTIGEAMRLFRLSEQEIHAIVCDCMGGDRVPGWLAARRVRVIAGTLPPYSLLVGDAIRPARTMGVVLACGSVAAALALLAL